MKMSKEDFVERFRRDRAEKDSNKYFAINAAKDFRFQGRSKNIRRNQRDRF